MSEQPEPLKTWGVVEILGHRRLAGLVSEQLLFGTMMCRIDVPTGDAFTTVYHSGASLYSFSPCDEAMAREVARYSPAPRFGTGPLITLGYYHEGEIQMDDVDPDDVDPSGDDSSDPMARTMPRLATFEPEDSEYININSPEGMRILSEAMQERQNRLDSDGATLAAAYVKTLSDSYDLLMSKARPVFEEPLTEDQIYLLEAWDSAHGGV